MAAFVALLAFPQFCRKAYSQQVLTIPFTQHNGFIVVDAVLNSYFPIRLVFDTGSEYTLLTEPLAFSMLELKGAEQIRLVGSDLSTAVEGTLSRRNRLQIRDINLVAHPIIAVESPAFDIEDVAGEGIFGLLGIGSFGAYVIEINYAKEEIRLVKPEQFRPPRNAINLPIKVANGKAYLRVDTKIHSAFRDSLDYLIDSGASLETLIYVAAKDSTVYPPAVVLGPIGSGLGGELVGFVGRSDTLDLGAVQLTGVVTHFQVETGESLRAEIVTRNGLIGNALLSRFTVSLDLPGRRLFLVPRPGFGRERPYDRSGLHVVRDGHLANRLRVQFVSPGSPAAIAGVRAGDRVLSINRRPASLMRPETLSRKLRGPIGRKIHLRLERGEARYTVEFHLRKLI